MRRERRAISTGLFAVVACMAGTICLGAPRAAADNAPEWLRAAAQEQLPAYPKDTKAVVLLDDEETTVKSDGEVETTYREAIKLLRPEARDGYGAVAVYSDNETKVLSLKAWTMLANGRVIAIDRKEAVRESLSEDDLFSDEYSETLQFPEANPGNIVGYEYVQRHRPFVFEDDWEFQEAVPTRRARFELTIPDGWEFTNAWANYPEQKAHSAGPREYDWEVQDVPGIDDEPDMPVRQAVAARMDIKYFPSDPRLRARTTESWQEIGSWYAGLAEPRATATPAIQQEVAKLTVGISDPVAKMKALGSYVQQNVRYVAIEIGIGGFQPHQAGDIFAHQYGDCKDKATLLKAMLHEIGIESYYVLIDTDRGVVSPDFPSTRFDHAILAIRLPANMPDASLYAEVNDPKLGRLLFFDPTNSYLPLGYLPWYLQDGYGLVVTSDGGTLMRMPLLPPTTNRLLRQAEFTLNSSGALTGDVQEVRWGAPAAEMRREYLSVPPSQRLKMLDNFLGNFVGNFVLEKAVFGDLEQYDQNLALSYQFVAEDYGKTAGDLLMVRPRVLGEKGSAIEDLLSEKPRKYPVDFGEATRQDDIFDIKVPAGYVLDELPKAVSLDCGYASYKSEIAMDGNTLHYHRTYEVKNISVPAQKIGELQAFLRQVVADERSEAIFRKASE